MKFDPKRKITIKEGLRLQLQEYLLRFPLFFNLEPTDLDPLSPYLSLKKFTKGQTLFTEGQIGSQVYFVLTGQIKLSKTYNHHEHIVDWCGPYQNFAEIVLLDPGPYPATAVAVEDSELIVLDNRGMHAVFAANPKMAVALIRNLTKKLRLAHEFILVLTTRSKAGVLANLLLRLARPGPYPGSPIGIDGELTHKELADMIGTSREVVTRTINQWKKMGIIRVNNKRLEILDPQQLVDWP